jgi:DNA-binding winged helix-turn-helix (wHTH) protein
MQIQFGDCALDVDRRELQRDNDRLVLEPLTLDLLQFLIANRQRVVSRDEIIAHVWNGRCVSDATISSCMTAVRQAIGDCGRKQALIRTYSRRGYRFVGEVHDAGLDCGRPAGLAASRSLISRRRPLVSVLAFAAPTSDLEPYADAIVEDMTTTLSQLGWLSVLARSVSISAGAWAADISELGTRLGVDYAVEGSVRRHGRHIRITVRLVSVASGTAIWSHRCDAATNKHDGPGDEIVGTIVSAIATRLELAELSAIKRNPIERDEASQHYYYGLHHLYRWNQAGLDRALEQFQMAADIDGAFAPAYGMAAYCYVQRQSNGWFADREKETAECMRLALRAAELAPDDPLVLSRSAHALAAVTQDCETGSALISRALEISPSLCLSLYTGGWIKLFLGDVAGGAAHLEQALKTGFVDPISFKTYAALSYAYLFLGRHDEGAAIAERVCSARPTYQTGLRAAAANHAMAGREVQARRLLARSLSLDPHQRLSALPDLLPFRTDFQMDRWSIALRRAGMPD